MVSIPDTRPAHQFTGAVRNTYVALVYIPTKSYMEKILVYFSLDKSNTILTLYFYKDIIKPYKE